MLTKVNKVWNQSISLLWRICNLKSITHCQLTQPTIEVADAFIVKRKTILIIKAGSFLHGLTRELVKLSSILLLGFADPIQSEDYWVWPAFQSSKTAHRVYLYFLIYLISFRYKRTERVGVGEQAELDIVLFSNTIPKHVCVGLLLTRCQVLCSMRLQCVSKILTPCRMLKKSSLIAKITRWNNSFQNMYDML